MLHGDRHSWLSDVHHGALVRVFCGSESSIQIPNRVLCEFKVDGHLSDFMSREGGRSHSTIPRRGNRCDCRGRMDVDGVVDLD